jgi:hypothetical protein
MSRIWDYQPLLPVLMIHGISESVATDRWESLMIKKPTHVTDATAEREKLTIKHMMVIYCRGHRHAVSGICADCGSILRYAHDRIDGCSYLGSAKPACGLCRSNCFTPEMDWHFTQIMRYAGPRMMVCHPILALAHFWDAIRGKF